MSKDFYDRNEERGFLNIFLDLILFGIYLFPQGADSPGLTLRVGSRSLARTSMSYHCFSTSLMKSLRRLTSVIGVCQRTIGSTPTYQSSRFNLPPVAALPGRGQNGFCPSLDLVLDWKPHFWAGDDVGFSPYFTAILLVPPPLGCLFLSSPAQCAANGAETSGKKKPKKPPYGELSKS